MSHTYITVLRLNCVYNLSHDYYHVAYYHVTHMYHYGCGANFVFYLFYFIIFLLFLFLFCGDRVVGRRLSSSSAWWGRRARRRTGRSSSRCWERASSKTSTSRSAGNWCSLGVFLLPNRTQLLGRRLQAFSLPLILVALVSYVRKNTCFIASEASFVVWPGGFFSRGRTLNAPAL